MQRPFFSSSSSSSSSFPSLPPSSTHPPTNGPAVSGRGRWGPYSSSKSFDVNMATILIILVLATVLAFALHAAISSLLRLFRRRNRHRRHRRHPVPGPTHSKQPPDSSPHSAIPTLVFSSGTKLAGGADECAICLSEFADGERLRVLPACNHGFHVKCVEAWLLSKSSCPTCRTSFLPPAPPPAAEP